MFTENMQCEQAHWDTCTLMMMMRRRRRRRNIRFMALERGSTCTAEVISEIKHSGGGGRSPEAPQVKVYCRRVSV